MSEVAYLATLELSTKARKCLETLGVRDSASLLAVTEKQVTSMWQAGRKTWNEIRDMQSTVRRATVLAQIHGDKDEPSK